MINQRKKKIINFLVGFVSAVVMLLLATLVTGSLFLFFEAVGKVTKAKPKTEDELKLAADFILRSYKDLLPTYANTEDYISLGHGWLAVRIGAAYYAIYPDFDRSNNFSGIKFMIPYTPTSQAEDGKTTESAR